MRWTPELILTGADQRRVMYGMGFETNPLTQLEAYLAECNDKNPRRNKDGWYVRFTTPEVKDEKLLALKDDVMTAAKALQMVSGEVVLRGSVDYAIASGGARWAPRDRLSHIINQITSGQLAVRKAIVAAGSGRILGPEELEAISGFAQGRVIETEFDLYCEAVDFVHKRHPELKIIKVFSPPPNSGNDQVIDAVMETIGDGKGLLFGLVTTAIYHAQACMDALRGEQRHDCKFEVAGHCSPPWQKFDRGILEHYLPELMTTWYKAAIAYHAGCY